MEFNAVSSGTVILYEDDFIKTMFYQGNSNFIVATFGNLINLAEGTNFFADVPLKKLDFSCIGYMAKTPNWFPAESMRKSAEIVREKRNNFGTLVCYGGSMGGYAAIKYSKLLGATHVIAFCPQWTIDKEECGGRNPGFQEYFKPTMQGMGIKSQDIDGKLFIFYDPWHQNDTYHANKILSLSNSAKPVKVRSVGHFVTGVLAGTKHINDFIRFAISDNLDGIKNVSNNVRRGHAIRARILLERSLTKHPSLLNKILRNPKIITKLSNEDRKLLNGGLLNFFIEQKKWLPALESIERLIAVDICPTRRSILKETKIALANLTNKQESLLTTNYNTIVAYDALRGRLIHKPVDAVLKENYLFPVAFCKYATFYAAFIESKGEKFLCQIVKSGEVKLGARYGADLELASLITTKELGGIINIKHRGKFVSADSDGKISFFKASARENENFKYFEKKP